MKSLITKVLVAATMVTVLSACGGEESKVKTAATNLVTEQLDKEFTKNFGVPGNSKIIDELAAEWNNKLKVEALEIKVEGDKATGQISVTHAGKDFSGLAFMIGMDAKGLDKKGRNIASLMDDMRKTDPRIPQLKDLPTEVTTKAFTAEKKDGQWAVTIGKEIKAVKK